MMYGDGARKVIFDDIVDAFQLKQFGSMEEENSNLRAAIETLLEDEDWNEHDDEVFAAADEDEVANAAVVGQFEAVAAEIPMLINTKFLNRYRKAGPFSKLHNIGVCLRLSTS